MSATVKPTVTRWAAELRDAGRDAGVDGPALVQFVSAGLAQIAHESAGNPKAENTKTKAFGLTQQMPRWYGKVWMSWAGGRDDVRAHLREYARQTWGVWRRSGSLVSAVAAWAHGEGGVKGYVAKGSPQHSWVAQQRDRYIDPLWRRSYAAYAAWVATWIALGEPTHEEGGLILADDAYQLTEQRWPGAPNPYQGVYEWGKKAVRVGPVKGIVSEQGDPVFGADKRASRAGLAGLAVGGLALTAVLTRRLWWHR